MPTMAQSETSRVITLTRDIQNLDFLPLSAFLCRLVKSGSGERERDRADEHSPAGELLKYISYSRSADKITSFQVVYSVG